MNLNQFYVTKIDIQHKVMTGGKSTLIAHVKSKLVHLLKGKANDKTVVTGTIVQLIEVDKGIGTFYIPSEDSSYMDILNDEHYQELKLYPFSNKLWDQVNED
jgi:hypothetical protein